MDRWTVVVVMCLVGALPAPALAQTAYKCSNGKGGNIYQQTPCATEEATRAEYRYRPSPPPTHSFQFAGRPGAQPAAQEYNVPQNAPRQATRTPDINPMSMDAERIRRAQNAARSMRGSPSARAATVAGILGQPAPVYTPAYTSPPNPNGGVGLPATVIDPRTSMPINGTNGVIMVAPNRAWNPRTGEYFDTTR